jgi:aryl-alcohol dehydrogenase-like predicted oxidoreductase
MGRQLATVYVDLYWMHIWDGVTPVEEIVQTLGDLVRAGKIRYYAFSDVPAWYAMKAANIAAERRIPGPIAMQLEYSLVARDVEGEHLPAAREAGMGVIPREPARRWLPDRQIHARRYGEFRATERRQPLRRQQVRRSKLGHPRSAARRRR